MPGGRPTSYSPELADKICEEIVLGFSLRTICKKESMPCVSTIFNWLRTNESFLEQYEKAKESQADSLAEEILDIADDGTNDWMERQNKDGSTYIALNVEHVQRSRLRVDARKWIASKLKPKKYGDSAMVKIGGDGGDAIKIDNKDVTQQILKMIPTEKLKELAGGNNAE